ncbi:hypothetical protein [Achromobacter xylosoxidans]|uniref:hypothetical protein n=1 Tax=Alcaligenes xylosoxydans xylosoxydans TaxID=85698 RepID=UPI0012A99D96|nr:hypothetical protein [Achromobacter xylosoxidans]CUR82601.1 hypothetical protein BN2910_59380 [Achromobacter xylosoxidans]
MKHVQYVEARDALFAILERQPNALKEQYPTEGIGKEMAQMAWAFIDEYHRQHQEKVKG